MSGSGVGVIPCFLPLIRVGLSPIKRAALQKIIEGWFILGCEPGGLLLVRVRNLNEALIYFAI